MISQLRVIPFPIFIFSLDSIYVLSVMEQFWSISFSVSIILFNTGSYLGPTLSRFIGNTSVYIKCKILSNFQLRQHFYSQKLAEIMHPQAEVFILIDTTSKTNVISLIAHFNILAVVTFPNCLLRWNIYFKGLFHSQQKNIQLFPCSTQLPMPPPQYWNNSPKLVIVFWISTLQDIHPETILLLQSTQ